MVIAYNLLPTRFEDQRHEAFKQGIQKLGYEIRQWSDAVQPTRNDLVLGWNAYGPTYNAMRKAAQSGGRALVFEEAYIRKVRGEQYFACAIGGHNGSGRWNVCGPERWESWGIDVKPWRRDGDHILVCGQRGFGYNTMAMTTEWPDTVLPRLRQLTNRPVWFRGHPKRRAKTPGANYDKFTDFTQPIERDLEGAWACVVFTSNSATNALLAGIPALFDGPNIVTAPSSIRGLDTVDEPILMGRDKGFISLSWAQWSVREFQTGEAFGWLLE